MALRTVVPGCITSEECIARVRARQSKTLLAFSAGKDSIAAWLVIREHFEEIVPVYRYVVPDLEFVEESLQYYERFFGVRIRRFPHPSMFRFLQNLVCQAPENCLAIEARAKWLNTTYDYARSNIELCRDAGLPEDTYCASGVRAADSPHRRLNFQKHGPISDRQRAYYPVWDWTKAALVEALQKSSVKMAVDYTLFGRTFDGLDYRFLAPIKKHFPRDFERILQWFPLADAELFRFEGVSR